MLLSPLSVTLFLVPCSFTPLPLSPSSIACAPPLATLPEGGREHPDVTLHHRRESAQVPQPGLASVCWHHLRPVPWHPAARAGLRHPQQEHRGRLCRDEPSNDAFLPHQDTRGDAPPFFQYRQVSVCLVHYKKATMLLRITLQFFHCILNGDDMVNLTQNRCHKLRYSVDECKALLGERVRAWCSKEKSKDPLQELLSKKDGLYVLLYIKRCIVFLK